MEETALIYRDERQEMAIALTALLERMPGVKMLLKGIVDLAAERCTVQGFIIRDLAQMIQRCTYAEELRDLSVQVRDLMFQFEPDAGRVAMTADELRVFGRLLESVERDR